MLQFIDNDVVCLTIRDAARLNISPLSAAYMRQSNGSTLVQMMANQYWNIVNWTIGNKLQWNINLDLYIFIQDNAFENVVWKMAAILSEPQCV